MERSSVEGGMDDHYVESFNGLKRECPAEMEIFSHGGMTEILWQLAPLTSESWSQPASLKVRYRSYPML